MGSPSGPPLPGICCGDLGYPTVLLDGPAGIKVLTDLNEVVKGLSYARRQEQRPQTYIYIFFLRLLLHPSRIQSEILDFPSPWCEPSWQRKEYIHKLNFTLKYQIMKYLCPDLFPVMISWFNFLWLYTLKCTENTNQTPCLTYVGKRMIYWDDDICILLVNINRRIIHRLVCFTVLLLN